jgi:hypothetical protein
MADKEYGFFDADTLAILEKAFNATSPVSEGQVPELPGHANLTPRERLISKGAFDTDGNRHGAI